MERFRYDRSSKWMIEHHGRIILYLGNVRDVEECRTRAAEVVQPRKLPDGLLDVRRHGDKHFHPFLIEIETDPDPQTVDDLVDDAMLVYLDRRELPDVITLVLRPKGQQKIADGTELRSRAGLTTCKLNWKVVNLWEFRASELLALGEPGMMPWVSLAQMDGAPEAIFKECRRIIDEKAKPDERENLLAVSQVLMGLNYNDPRLFDIFGGRDAMIKSPVLRDLVVRTPHKIILGILTDRFTHVPKDVQDAITLVDDENRLEQLARKAARCNDLNAFKQEIESRSE